MSHVKPFNKIAIIGHRGWVAGPIVRALAAASPNAPIRILHRAQSSTQDLPTNTEPVPFSWEDESSITAGLKGIDILL
jgi:nucleoside-diphosphate-sugar epimerase